MSGTLHFIQIMVAESMEQISAGEEGWIYSDAWSSTSISSAR